MKWIAVLVCSSAFAWAQTRPPDPPGNQGDFLRAPDSLRAPGFLKLWREARNLRLPNSLGPEQPEKPCSIPLLNVTPKVHSRMPVIPPERLGRTVPMPEVEMPAPPCPEEKRN